MSRISLDRPTFCTVRSKMEARETSLRYTVDRLTTVTLIVTGLGSSSVQANVRFHEENESETNSDQWTEHLRWYVRSRNRKSPEGKGEDTVGYCSPFSIDLYHCTLYEVNVLTVLRGGRGRSQFFFSPSSFFPPLFLPLGMFITEPSLLGVRGIAVWIQ